MGKGDQKFYRKKRHLRTEGVVIDCSYGISRMVGLQGGGSGGGGQWGERSSVEDMCRNPEFLFFFLWKRKVLIYF